MRIHFTLLYLGFLSAIIQLNAQNPHHCGTMQHLHQTLQQHPGLNKIREKIELQAATDAVRTDKGGDETYFIPVVVHVVYNTVAQNISMAQIQSQIDVLNEDFAGTNAD